jgi:hypothetical protein
MIMQKLILGRYFCSLNDRIDFAELARPDRFRRRGILPPMLG